MSAAPACRDLLRQAAERGEPLGRMARALGELLDPYGAAELQRAALDALGRGVPHVSAVRLALERRRLQRHDPPPVAVPLPPQGGPGAHHGIPAQNPARPAMSPAPQPSGITQGLTLLIDPHWSPEQALAVVKLLDDLRARIWAHYELALQARLRDDRTTALDINGVDDPPF